MSRRLEPGVFLGRSLRTTTVGDLTLTNVRYTRGAARHHHQRAYFSLIRRGEYDETFGRRTRVCRPGLLVFHPAGESHAQVLRTEAVAAVNLEIGPDWLQHMVDAGLPIDQSLECEHPDVIDAVERLTGDAAARGGSALIVEGLAADFVARLARTPARGEQAMPRWVRDVRDRVAAEAARPPRLSALAVDAGVHPLYLAQAFRRFAGCSLGEYARRHRLEHARRLVAAGHLPLVEIASEAGFADQSHFTRTFKRFTGLTPRQYRTFLAFKTR
jgi:AraC family transcriptional regulator